MNVLTEAIDLVRSLLEFAESRIPADELWPECVTEARAFLEERENDDEAAELLVGADVYQALALRTETTPAYMRSACDELTDHELSRLDHALRGITTEVGEAQDVLKRLTIYGKPPALVNVAEEFGDLLWYIALGCSALGIGMGRAMLANVNKLAARYPDGFSQYAALNRDLEAERIALARDITNRVRS